MSIIIIMASYAEFSQSVSPKAAVSISLAITGENFVVLLVAP
jgi:hypothetical protein